MLVSPRLLACLLLLVVAAGATPRCWAKPTREQIVAFAEECKEQQKRMDLVAKFGSDFSGLDLSGVDFRGYYAVGYESILRGADFSNCNLQNAEFGAAILDGADVTGANLAGASFITASLKDVVLLNVNLQATKFYQSDFSGAKLAKADLSNADITGSKFAGADLSNANFAGAKSEYWWNDFRNANLSGANLRGLNLNGARFQYADLQSADLSDAELIQANFTGADLTGCNLKDANVEAAVFRDVRGLGTEEKQRLESKAQRWKFELKTGVSHFLTAAYFPTYVLVVIALIGMSITVFRLRQRRGVLTVAACTNILALLPACLMIWMFASGAHPTVQFNVGSQPAMAAWSMWVDLWPLLMIALLGCLGVSVLTALVFVATTFRLNELKKTWFSFLYILLTVAHCLFSTHWIGSNCPSA